MPKIDFKIQKSPQIDSNGFLSWAPQSAENNKNVKNFVLPKNYFGNHLKIYQKKKNYNFY